jgi:heat shock protein HtpX
MSLSAVGLNTWIWNNNLKSTFLLVSYPILLLFLLWLFFAAVDFTQASQAYHYVPDLHRSALAGWTGVLRYGLYVLLATGAWFTVAFAFHQGIINSATGAHAVRRNEAPDIYNLLENLCISRGMAMPRLYIVESPVLNAYASGLSETSFSITLTRGLIDTLSKEELETVIAHELTHIMNRDVRLLVISIVFVGMLSFLSEMAFRTLLRGNHSRFRYHSDRDRGGGAVILLIATVVLGIGYFLSLLIRFTLSRQREFLADAGAVELTKNPSGLIGALIKISGNANLPAPDEVKQMYIENSQAFLGMFATHPPIPKRIEALKMMGGTYIEDAPAASGPWNPNRSGPWG